MDTVPITPFTVLYLIILYLTSTFFSIVKLVLSSVDRDAIPVDNEKRRYFASKVEELLENRHLFSATVAVGKTTSKILFALLAYHTVCKIFPEKSHLQVAIISAPMSIIILSLFAYSVSRAILLVKSESMFIIVYTIYAPFRYIFAPLSALMVFCHKTILKILKYDEKYSFLSQAEKSRLAENSYNEQTLDKEERDMIHNIFELGDSTVKEIMLPRIDIKGIEINTGFRNTLNIINEAGHSRFPVYSETIDSISGILYAKDILAWIAKNPTLDHEKEWSLKSLIKDAIFVPGSKKLDDMMEDIKKHHVHISVVVDEYGGTEGIVTMEDILEEIVGEIRDEFDTEEESVLKISNTLFKVNPHVELDDLSEIIDYTFDTDEMEYNTIGGLFYHEFGGVPVADTTIEHKGIKLKILNMDQQRIKRIELEILHDPDNPVDLEKSF